MPKVSIIVPVYNSKNYIKKCIESILNQTYDDFELLIVDDGSNDNTESIIKKYNDERIKYFKTENNGAGNARNLGIDKSSGEFIVFVDSDDYIAKEFVEKLVNKVESESLEIAVCNFYKKKKNRIKKEKINHFENSNLKNNEELLLEIGFELWNKIYKKSLIIKNKLRFNDNIRYEYIPFVLDALLYAKKVGHIDEYLYYFVIHVNSETYKASEKEYDILSIFKEMNAKYKGNNKEIIKRITLNELNNYIIDQKNQKDKKIREKTINEIYDYFEKEIPDYKNNKYYKDKGIFRRIKDKNRNLSMMYCNISAKTNKKRKEENTNG